LICGSLILANTWLNTYQYSDKTMLAMTGIIAKKV